MVFCTVDVDCCLCRCCDVTNLITRSTCSATRSVIVAVIKVAKRPVLFTEKYSWTFFIVVNETLIRDNKIHLFFENPWTSMQRSICKASQSVENSSQKLTYGHKWTAAYDGKVLLKHTYSVSQCLCWLRPPAQCAEAAIITKKNSRTDNSSLTIPIVFSNEFSETLNKPHYLTDANRIDKYTLFLV